jgi:hypothetical protein
MKPVNFLPFCPHIGHFASKAPSNLEIKHENFLTVSRSICILKQNIKRKRQECYLRERLKYVPCLILSSLRFVVPALFIGFVPCCRTSTESLRLGDEFI